MFKWLSEFDKILVTGPQRSGTRICATMIANDTGYEYIDEIDLQMESLYKLCYFIEDKHHFVVQCPTLCRYIHHFTQDDLAIILMRRNVADIIASQKRIHWRWEWLELARYDRVDGNISEVKYNFWDEHQKSSIKHAYEIQYESLANHPLWVDSDLRRDFKPEQITVHYNTDNKPLNEIHPQANILYWEPSDHDKALIVKNPEKVNSLNATGQLIWGLLNGKHSRQEVLQALGLYFEDVDKKTLSIDLDHFIDNLHEDGFLWIPDKDI